MKRFIIIYLLFTIIILTFGCNDEKKENLNEQPIAVKTIIVKKGSISYENTYSGTIEESESQSLSFPVIGTVSKVYVSEGDYVRKGQLLAEINNSTYKNTYNITLAKKNQAEDAYKRLEPMYKNGTLPEIKMVEIETALNEAKSALEIAKKNLDDCKLYATTDGFIGKRSIDPGMNFQAGFSCITIVKINKVYAKISVPENEISNFKVGTKANIFISALNETFSGIIEEIGVIGDLISHTYKVKIAIDNNQLKIKPGMIATVKIEKSSDPNNIIIPAQSILYDNDGKNYIFLAKNYKAIKQYIQIGKIINDGVEVINGLNENDELIVAGFQKITNGSTIKIINK